VALSERQRAAVMARFEVLKGYLHDSVSLARVAAEAGVPLRTVRRWLACYRAAGLAGLARRTRSDRGQRRLPDELVLLIEGLALRRPPPSIATVHRQAAEAAKHQGWPTPSYATVYDIARRLDPALVTLAHEGTKRYQAVFELVHRREAATPNEIWQADHTRLDLWVIAPSGKPARPWLTVIEDDHSRAIAGYTVSLDTPSAVQTALALRQGIWRKSEPAWHVCGIP
jgi:putative transposase